jgi:hypothetical protein
LKPVNSKPPRSLWFWFFVIVAVLITELALLGTFLWLMQDVLQLRGSWVPVQHHGPFKGSTAGHYSYGVYVMPAFFIVHGLAYWFYLVFLKARSGNYRGVDWSQVESREDWEKRYAAERKASGRPIYVAPKTIDAD